MFVPEIGDYDPDNPFEAKSWSLHYDYEMAAHEHVSEARWRKIARAGAIIIGLMSPATLFWGHIEHLPSHTVHTIMGVEGLAGAIAVRRLRSSPEITRQHESKMDISAIGQQALAEQHHVAPQEWAEQHELWNPDEFRHRTPPHLPLPFHFVADGK